MQVIQGTTDFKIQEQTVVALGKFDGIHRGHQSLMKELAYAKEEGLKTLIFTFEPSPAVFFSGKEFKELSTKEEKRAFFKQFGIDYLIEFPLTKETAQTSPKAFVLEILVEKLNIKKVVAGADLSFGDKGTGNCETLRIFQKEYAYEVIVLEKICCGEREISSTYIREEIEIGNIYFANKLLGEPYTISGMVVAKSDTKISLQVDKIKLLPPEGNYRAQLIGEKLIQKAKIREMNINIIIGNKEDLQIEATGFPMDTITISEILKIKLLDKLEE